MRRLVSILAALVMSTTVRTAIAVEIPDRIPVDLHGRLDTVVEIDESSTPFPWNHSSRSPLAGTRLMTSVAAGNEASGRFYVEGVARWNRVAEGDERAHLEFEQGDYVWRPSDASRHAVRLFANERRYFTASLAPTMICDDRVERYRAHGGGRVDGGRGALGWNALGALLDDQSARARRLGYASLHWYGAVAQARVSYLSDHQGSSGLDTHAIMEGEVVGFYRRLTVVANYRQSGFDHRAVFLPDGSFDFSGYVGSNFAASLPVAGAAFGEARLRGFPLRTWGHVDVVARYMATGADYVNDLAGSPPGAVSSSTGLFFRHDDVALDGRVVYERRARWGAIATRSERVLADARAFLKNGSELFLRGAVGFREDEHAHRTNENFVHAVVRRSLQKMEAGAHAMVKDIDDGRFERRFAIEARLNWSANISVYGRVVANENAGSSDAEFWRLEMRPADHVFVTLGYGRRVIGDAAYMLEDLDIGQTGDEESVYTITVRGDF